MQADVTSDASSESENSESEDEEGIEHIFIKYYLNS